MPFQHGETSMKNMTEMITDSVVFDHRGRAKKCEGPVEIRITIDRKSYYFPTGVKILRKEFAAGSVVDRPDSDELNERIRIVRSKVLSAINECLKNDLPIDIGSIRKKVWCSSMGSHTMMEWIEKQLPLLGLRDGTLKHYRTLLMRLDEYGQMSSWHDLTTESIYRWDAWLHQLKGWDGKPISDGGVYTYHKCLKALIQRAVRMGVIQTNPYDRLRGEFKRGERETVDYLTEDEMKKIEGLVLEPGSPLEKARDLFVFQMYTGLSYSDLMAFDMKGYRMEDGMWTAQSERIKTGVPYICRLLPPAVRILEKYGYNLPKLDNSDYNRNLKGIGVAAGIAVPLHSHMARHTFATYMLNNGVSLDSVSVMVGHTNTVQTRRYAKTLARTVRDDFDKVAEKMKTAPWPHGQDADTK